MQFCRKRGEDPEHIPQGCRNSPTSRPGAARAHSPTSCQRAESRAVLGTARDAPHPRHTASSRSFLRLWASSEPLFPGGARLGAPSGSPSIPSPHPPRWRRRMQRGWGFPSVRSPPPPPAARWKRPDPSAPCPTRTPPLPAAGGGGAPQPEGNSVGGGVVEGRARGAPGERGVGRGEANLGKLKGNKAKRRPQH